MKRIPISQKDIEAFEQPGPRYTSYPTVPVWKELTGDLQFREALKLHDPKHPLSLYIHLPFCVRLCHFCACTKIIDKDHKLGTHYLEALFKEIELVRNHLSAKAEIHQLHYGGGTPTYYGPNELSRLSEKLRQAFLIHEDAELSVEANPVVTTIEHLRALRDQGFWRISFGVQDFDSEVQRVINREQSFDQTRQLAEHARELGFKSLNLDLIYGLPLQTEATIESTIKQVQILRPDRIALYSFAKVPWRQPFQRRFRDEDLPTGLNKVNLYLKARELLEDAGYEAVGMDHFALPHDELFQARSEKRLHRNFMGYTTLPEAQMIGLGLSGISMFDEIYVQNDRNLQDYYRKLEAGLLPIERGHILNTEDRLRRSIIMDLMCNFELDFKSYEDRYQLRVPKFFEKEFVELDKLAQHGLLKLDESQIQILPRGQVLVRNIAMVFDQYLSESEHQKLFSQTI